MHKLILIVLSSLTLDTHNKLIFSPAFYRLALHWSQPNPWKLPGTKQTVPLQCQPIIPPHTQIRYVPARQKKKRKLLQVNKVDGLQPRAFNRDVTSR